MTAPRGTYSGLIDKGRGAEAYEVGRANKEGENFYDYETHLAPEPGPETETYAPTPELTDDALPATE